MDAARQRALDDFEGGLREALRHLALVRTLVKPRADDLPGLWIGLFDACLRDMFTALRDAEDEVLQQQRRAKQRRPKAKLKTKAKTKAKRTRADRASGQPDNDPTTIPGAIRIALTKNPGGLKMAELIEAVLAIRPETPEGNVPSSLHPMRKRGEISRDGFHKNYRYRSKVSTPNEAAGNVSDS